jgi:hypothetical protein
MKDESIIYATAWKKPYEYYTNFVWSWYMFLKNSKNISSKDELKKLIFKEEMKRIGI